MKKLLLMVLAVAVVGLSVNSSAATVAEGLTERFVRNGVKAFIKKEVSSEFSILSEGPVLIFNDKEQKEYGATYGTQMLVNFPFGTQRGTFLLINPTDSKGKTGTPAVINAGWEKP